MFTAPYELGVSSVMLRCSLHTSSILVVLKARATGNSQGTGGTGDSTWEHEHSLAIEHFLAQRKSLLFGGDEIWDMLSSVGAERHSQQRSGEQAVLGIEPDEALWVQDKSSFH